MSKASRRRDRTARLLNLQMLLSRNPDGIEIEKLAQKCETSKRTVYRDLEVLEQELKIPIWQHDRKRGIEKGYYLPPLYFTLDEAMNLFLAARIMQNYSSLCNPSLTSILIKLNNFVPEPIKKQILYTIEHIENQSHDKLKISNFNTIVQAWKSQHRIKFSYQGFLDEKPLERIVEPYFIEPSPLRRSPILIGYCHLKKSIYAYNIDNLIGNVIIENSTYTIPSDFNVIEYLNSAWDTYIFDGELSTVKVHFSKQTSRGIQSTIWHPTQKTEFQSDGSMILTLKTRLSLDFRAWILGWGDDIEVLEPDTLRKWVVSVIRSVRRIYKNGELPEKPIQSDKNIYNYKSIEITDDQWISIRDILPTRARTGRPRADDRKTINGILWMINTQSKWADIPQRYGSHSTCYSRYQMWKKQGIWKSITDVMFPADD
jgi:predicted DNA-binding transcriptional regulator YafY